ncbi:energy transducer TonB [Sphingomonas sp. KR1UV-12]|uniref:Energy transducer TonB n=1 Tax=Sphingomonas aurea TaxID=3063994 RepID=A0ABT9ELE4_9SPHN|nr:energy transducer TonB [Sphingomonas sp. KR1UV-12]MDP1027798.1 energy transducer TonB [Sphingomonas sp. KR1UV-12]
MYGEDVPLRQRIGPAALTATVVAAIGWVLASGLGVARTAAVQEALATFDVLPRPEPPVRVVPKRQRSHRPEGRAAPPGLRSQATEVVAVRTVVPPPPVIAAPVAGTGSAATQGAAERPGPGPGAGGIGDGRGSGGDGDGDGGEGYETEPHWLRGRLSFKDGWDVAGDAVIGRSISVRCTLTVRERLTGCVAARSSGIAALDARVFELIERRFRYSPWLDARGRPVESTVLIDQAWDGER